MYNIVEIFKSIEGEGIRTGEPVTFVRFANCTLRCSWCDTTYSYSSDIYMTYDEIVEEIQKLGLKKITFTGGEPLLNPSKDFILQFVKKHPDYEVNIETNGSVAIPDELLFAPNTILTVDYKCPSSGMTYYMAKYTEDLRILYDVLRPKDVLKFVVGTDEDLQEVLKIVDYYRPKCNIYLSPVFNTMNLQKLAKFIVDNANMKLRMGLQIHKIIWSPETRGV